MRTGGASRDAKAELEGPSYSKVHALVGSLCRPIENLNDAREELDPTTIQYFTTSVVGLRYRTSSKASCGRPIQLVGYKVANTG
ncbi:hypothetical protein BRC91_06175 [Halobacteriales archaeon QS_4_62_28]|nr:MAG: hypothetical protein BRC91_06175 [Halobacteriales archaeon QS_4_62_28]